MNTAQNSKPNNSSGKKEKLTLKEEHPHKKGFIFLGGTMIICGFILAFTFRYNSNMVIEKEETITEEKTIVQIGDQALEEENRVEEAPVEIDKTLVTIQILNGTGVAGLAATTEIEVKGLGYTDIEIGNAPTYDAEETLVTYKNIVQEELIDELVDLLDITFEEISEQKNLEETASHDIIITTGKLLDI